MRTGPAEPGGKRGTGGGVAKGGRSRPGKGAGWGYPSRPARGYGGAPSGSGAPPEKPTLFCPPPPPPPKKNKYAKNCRSRLGSHGSRAQPLCMFKAPINRRVNVPNAWLVSMVVLNSPFIRLENALEAPSSETSWAELLQLRYIKSLNPFEKGLICSF